MIACMPQTKQDLRRRIRAARTARDTARRLADAEALLVTARESGLLGSPRDVGPITLAAYVAAPGEPDVGPIRAAVRTAGGTVLLPLPGPRGTLGWAIDEGAYRQHDRLPVPVPHGGPLGSGPEALVTAGTALVLAPALAVDRAGTRLGQGGGFYDRLLAGLAGRIPVVAVVHDDELLAAGALPCDQHDWPVDAALTPERLVWFRG